MGGKRCSDAEGEKGCDDSEQPIDPFHCGSLDNKRRRSGLVSLSAVPNQSESLVRMSGHPEAPTPCPLVESQQIRAHALVERQRRLCDLGDEKAAPAIFRAADLVSRFR